jgi:hypothetical protein
MAKLLGVSPQTLARLAREGIAEKGTRAGSYAMTTPARYIKHLQEGCRGGAGTDDWQAARTRNMVAKAAASEYELRRLQGELVEAKAVEAMQVAICMGWRNRIWGWPAIIAPRLLLCKDEQEIVDFLREGIEEHMIDFRSERGIEASLELTAVVMERRQAKKGNGEAKK